MQKMRVTIYIYNKLLLSIKMKFSNLLKWIKENVYTACSSWFNFEK